MSCEQEKNGMVGQRIPIRDAAMKVTGQTRYVADMKLPDMLYAKVLFSTVAHGKIKRIDISKAQHLPGVRAVVCYKNSPQVYFNSCGEVISSYHMERIFDDTVRYVGDKVAAVAADDLKTAERALRLVEVEYEPLPVNIDPEAGMQPDAYPLHHTPDLFEGNIIEKVVQSCGDVDTAMMQAHRVYEDSYRFPAIHHGAIETHAAIANYDAAGKLTVYTSSQDSFAVRTNLAKIFALPMSRIRVVVPAVGGAFGGKIDMIIEHVAALLSMRTGRPVKLVYNRAESMVSTRTRHAMTIKLKTGVKQDGTILAQDFTVCCNAGAYACGSSSIVWAMCGRLFKLLQTPNIRFTGYPVLTNTPIGGPMRGFGSPQAFFAQQRQMNRIAIDLGLDMVEMERRNLVWPSGVDLRFQAPHGNARVRDCMEKALELIDYEAAKQEEQATRGQRHRIGVGIGAGAHGNGMFGIRMDSTGMMIKMNDDGSCVLFTGSHDMGNASVTLQQQLVSEVLGISMDRISCVAGDTEATCYHLGDYSSRGTYVSGHAAVKVAEKMRSLLAEQGAAMLEVPADMLDFRKDTVVVPDGKALPLEELVQYARNTMGKELACAETYASEFGPISYGVHAVKVSVDTQTGAVTLSDYAAVHDVGRAINPLSVEGQIEGAVQMGIGYALSEALEWEESGRVKNASFRKYHMITTEEMPKRLQVSFVDGLEQTGPYGAKSIGECSVVPAIAAIGNAISNALELEFCQVPIRKDDILTALVRKGEQQRGWVG